MTAATGCRFNLSDIAAGTVAISALGFASTDKIAFGVIREEMVVFRIPI